MSLLSPFAPEHEHTIVQGNLLPKFRDTITLPSAVNLTGATFGFRYFKAGGTVVARTASLVAGSAKPSLTAATSFDLEFAPISADSVEAGVFDYRWRANLLGEPAPLDLPTDVDPEPDGTPRKHQRFEVIASV